MLRGTENIQFENIPIIFFIVDNGELLVVRTCVLEDISSGGKSCGNFHFQGNPDNDSIVDVMSGCILTCDYDGCNGAEHLIPNYFYYLFMLPFVFFQMKMLILQ